MHPWLSRHRRRVSTILMSLAAVLFLAGCNSTLPVGPKHHNKFGAAFGEGVWHGFMSPIISFGNLLGLSDRSVVNDNNNGSGYYGGWDLGLFLFICALIALPTVWLTLRRLARGRAV